MAKCPNCGKVLHFTDWKQDCPACGVNLIYFKSNERLLAESEKAEIEHAEHQPSIDRAKAAFFGSAKAIIRLVLSVLPIASLFLPLCKIKTGSDIKSINAIGLYNFISKADFGENIKQALRGKSPYISILLLLISVLMIIICVIFLTMSLGKHGKQRNLILNLIMLVSAVLSAVFLLISGGRNYSLNFGAYIYILLIILITAFNIYLAKTGMPVKYTTCYIGGLKSDDYFRFIEEGMSELEIRKKMVDALTEMQEKVRAKEKEAAQKEEEHRKAMK